MQTQTIGFVGLGRMGHALAAHLIAAGHGVRGYRRGDMSAFAAAGGTPCTKLPEILEGSDVIFGCLPSESAFHEVYLDDDGLLSRAQPGQLFVEFGTQDLALKRAAQVRAEAAGAVFLDAEISGTPMMVQAKRAVLFLAGDMAAYEQVTPLLETMADLSFHLGGFGNANRMKLIANHLVAVHNLVTAEVMLMGERAGLDPQAIIAAIERSGGGSTIFSIRAPWMAERRYTPAAGPIGDLAKYFDLIQALATEQNTATPLLDVAADHYRSAVAQGRGDQDVAAVWVTATLNPASGPSEPRKSWSVRINSLKGLWKTVGIFVLVMGGIYGGVFSPTEAAGIGAGAAFVLALGLRMIRLNQVVDIVAESAATTAALMFLVMGAVIFSAFVNIGGLSAAIGSFVSGLEVQPFTVMLVIIAMYIVLGCVLEAYSMILLTVPIVYPIVAALGYDLVWFGIVLVIVVEISLITPPIGMNVFVLRAVVPDVETREIFKGLLPFILADVLRVMLIISIPSLALYLPQLMLR